MTREELRDYVEFLRSQDEISYNVYSELIDGIDTLEQEMSDDTISRAKVLESSYTIVQTSDYGENVILEVVEAGDIMKLPPVTPKQKIGHWGKDGECPFCGYLRQWDDDNFCGHCGAWLEHKKGEE